MNGTYKNKPVIGITPAFDEAMKIQESQKTLYLRRTYTTVLESVGAIPVILNPDMPLEYIVELCDGIVISGGEDVDPAYNLGREFLHLKEPKERTDWEFSLLKLCEKQQTPVLGICYGMQILVLYNGGALHQDIETEVPNSINHNITTHDVVFHEPFLGFAEKQRHSVESRHHQAVSLLPDNFRVCASAPDGIIEAIAGNNCYGIQWHPESDETGIHIYRAFVEQCQKG